MIGFDASHSVLHSACAVTSHFAVAVAVHDAVQLSVTHTSSPPVGVVPVVGVGSVQPGQVQQGSHFDGRCPFLQRVLLLLELTLHLFLHLANLFMHCLLHL